MARLPPLLVGGQPHLAALGALRDEGDLFGAHGFDSTRTESSVSAGAEEVEVPPLKLDPDDAIRDGVMLDEMEGHSKLEQSLS